MKWNIDNLWYCKFRKQQYISKINRVFPFLGTILEHCYSSTMTPHSVILLKGDATSQHVVWWSGRRPGYQLVCNMFEISINWLNTWFSDIKLVKFTFERHKMNYKFEQDICFSTLLLGRFSKLMNISLESRFITKLANCPISVNEEWYADVDINMRFSFQIKNSTVSRDSLPS